MKKYFFILLFIISFPVFATTVCSKNDAISIVLDPNESVKGYKVNNTSGRAIWSTDNMNYEALWACLDNDGTTDGEITAVGGETTGRYCWAKLTHPVISKWVIFGAHSNNTDCKDRCNGTGYYYSLGYSLRYQKGLSKFTNNLSN